MLPENSNSPSPVSYSKIHLYLMLWTFLEADGPGGALRLHLDEGGMETIRFSVGYVFVAMTDPSFFVLRYGLILSEWSSNFAYADNGKPLPGILPRSDETARMPRKKIPGRPILTVLCASLHAQIIYVGQVGSEKIGEYDATTGGVINANFISGLNDPWGLALSGNSLFVASYDARTAIWLDNTMPPREPRSTPPSSRACTAPGDSRCLATTFRGERRWRRLGWPMQRHYGGRD
jgi:hypothetical protein